MSKISMIGLDLAKNVFQVHGIDDTGQVVLRRRLRRGQVTKFFADLEPAVVGMEACGGAHYWARVLQGFAHEVRLMPAAYVKPYVKRNKTDSRDAEAICEAMQRPNMRFVAVKSRAQQAELVMQRTRELLVRQRTMLANAIRGHLAEFGIVAAQGTKGLRTLLAQRCLGEELPAPAREAVAALAGQWQALDGQIRALDLEIVRRVRAHEAAHRLTAVPGIGPITAHAIVASVGDARMFRSGRGFAAWLGLTARQSGTGGKQRSGPISKQGNQALRRLLITGATAHLRQQRRRGVGDPWLSGVLDRRPAKVAAVALAARTARIVWAMLNTGEPYRHRARLPAQG